MSGGTGVEARRPMSKKTVTALAPADVANLANFAPNIRSLVGSDYFLAGPDGGIMTEAERQERLKDLSEHFGFSGEEAVRKAQVGELPHEPEYAEWLVLLGRGDLL